MFVRFGGQLEETVMVTPAGTRTPCPSGAVCSAGVKRLRLLGAFKRCGVCDKRNPFKRVFKCRGNNTILLLLLLLLLCVHKGHGMNKHGRCRLGCKMVYHRDCGERTLAAAAFTVEEDRDVLVDPVNPTATRQAATTTTTPTCINVYVLAYTYIHMGTYVLVVERRR